MTIGDLCEFKTNYQEADFWMIKKGSKKDIGKPVETFSPEYIGVKVIRTDVLYPKYLYYAFLNMYNQGVFEQICEVNDGGERSIPISVIKSIPIG